MKKKVCVVFGGRSAEHEVSIHSALSVFGALDDSKYERLLLGMDKSGAWRLGRDASCIVNAADPKLAAIADSTPEVTPAARPGGGANLRSAETGKIVAEVDLFFPVMHGTLGEDGALQGFFRVLDTPFAGADVLSSAVGMDKDVMKRLLTEASFPVTPSRVLRRGEARLPAAALVEELGLPIFVKPCNLGSSVGISRVTEAGELIPAVEEALLYDDKVIVETAVEGREIECAVLGDATPRASLCGEIVPTRDFYSYRAKYLDPEAARLIAPTDLAPAVLERIQKLAVECFRVIECSGMARVDFFLKNDGEVLVNEINTLPGFTSISMYPKLWEVSGLPYPDLLDSLIELGFERHSRRSGLKREA